MKFLSNIFGKDKEEVVHSFGDFWTWFIDNEKQFYSIVKTRGDIEHDMLDKITPKLSQLHDGIFLLCGMQNEDTAELILTPDGNIKHIVFAEEIVAAAPEIDGWKFTALKPEADEGFYIGMQGLKVGEENLYFYANELWEQPDEIDIIIVHDDLNEDNSEAVKHAVFIFLDNYLGELTFATAIDNLSIIGKHEAEKELRPIIELKPYLAKRQNDFMEKYEGSRINTDDDAHSVMEAELESGFPLVAVVNTTLLTWDRKPSHPWIVDVEFKFDGNEFGLADENTYEILNNIEEDILAELKDADGYLNIGRETAKGVRSVYFACKEFRKPSKVLHEIRKRNAYGIEMDFEIYKDKYWQSFNHFIPTEGDEYEN